MAVSGRLQHELRFTQTTVSLDVDTEVQLIKGENAIIEAHASGWGDSRRYIVMRAKIFGAVSQATIAAQSFDQMYSWPVSSDPLFVVSAASYVIKLRLYIDAADTTEWQIRIVSLVR